MFVKMFDEVDEMRFSFMAGENIAISAGSLVVEQLGICYSDFTFNNEG